MRVSKNRRDRVSWGASLLWLLLIPVGPFLWSRFDLYGSILISTGVVLACAVNALWLILQKPRRWVQFLIFCLAFVVAFVLFTVIGMKLGTELHFSSIENELNEFVQSNQDALSLDGTSLVVPEVLTDDVTYIVGKRYADDSYTITFTTRHLRGLAGFGFVFVSANQSELNPEAMLKFPEKAFIRNHWYAGPLLGIWDNKWDTIEGRGIVAVGFDSNFKNSNVENTRGEIGK